MSIAEHLAALKDGTDEAKEKAAAALYDLAEDLDPDDFSPFVEQPGVVLPLVELLRSGSDGGKVQAATTLSFFEKDAEVIEAGGVPALAKIILSDSVSEEVKSTAARTLGRLTRETGFTRDMQSIILPTISTLVKVLGSGKVSFQVAIPVLLKLLRDGRHVVKLLAAVALREIAKDDKDVQAALIEAGAVPLLGELLLLISLEISESSVEKAVFKQEVLKREVLELLWELKFKTHAASWVVVEQAADLFFASASAERRAAKARVRELESELADLKRKLPAKNGG